MSPREQGPSAADGGEAVDPAVLESGRRRLRFVAGVLEAEAAALLGVTIFLVANLVGGSQETTETKNTVIETVGFFGFAVVLMLLARGCLRARRWARAPVIVVQLIALLGIGLNLLQGDLWYGYLLGVPLTLGSALAALALLTPSVGALLDLDES